MKTYKEIIPSDLFIILVWIVATFIFITIPTLENSIIRTILGIPFILFIPGYVLIAALFTKKDDLDTIERIVLSFGLSIAIVPLLGLLLNYTTFGIILIPVLVIICMYDIIFISITIYRRRELPEDKQFSIQFDKTYEIINNEINTPKNKIERILTTILIFTIILAIGITYYAVTPKIGDKFTEFYVLGPSGKAENYPTELKLGSTVTLLTGVVNHEHSPINYTLQIIFDNNILSSEELILNHNETWEKNITFVPYKKGNDEKLELLLFKENNFTTPYRELYLWIDTI